MITLKAIIDSRMRFHKVFDHLESLAADESDDMSYLMFTTAFELFSETVDLIFDQEGIPQWEPLGPRTIKERHAILKREGGDYDDESPILHRTGILQRSLTDLTFTEEPVTIPTVDGEAPIYSGNVVDLQPIPGGKAWLFGTSDERFISLQEGNDMWPARPMVPEGHVRAVMNTEIEGRLVALIRGMAHV